MSFFYNAGRVVKSRGAKPTLSVTNKRFDAPIKTTLKGVVPESFDTSDIKRAAVESGFVGAAVGFSGETEHGDKATITYKLEEVSGDDKADVCMALLTGALGSMEEHVAADAYLAGLAEAAEAAARIETAKLQAAARGATLGNANGATHATDPRGVGAALNGAEKPKKAGKGANGAAADPA